MYAFSSTDYFDVEIQSGVIGFVVLKLHTTMTLQNNDSCSKKNKNKSFIHSNHKSNGRGGKVAPRRFTSVKC